MTVEHVYRITFKQRNCKAFGTVSKFSSRLNSDDSILKMLSAGVGVTINK